MHSYEFLYYFLYWFFKIIHFTHCMRTITISTIMKWLCTIQDLEFDNIKTPFFLLHNSIYMILNDSNTTLSCIRYDLFPGIKKLSTQNGSTDKKMTNDKWKESCKIELTSVLHYSPQTTWPKSWFIFSWMRLKINLVKQNLTITLNLTLNWTLNWTLIWNLTIFKTPILKQLCVRGYGTRLLIWSRG